MKNLRLLSINYTGGTNCLPDRPQSRSLVLDVWWKGANAGFSNSLDEILLLTGVALLAGSVAYSQPEARPRKTVSPCRFPFWQFEPGGVPRKTGRIVAALPRREGRTS
jgi:hypothetical protein